MQVCIALSIVVSLSNIRLEASRKQVAAILSIGFR